MTTRWLVVLCLGACVGATEEPTPVDCQALAITTPDGDPDPCDVQACEACADLCGTDCAVQESFPPTYSCGAAGSFDVYDTCPEWQAPNWIACEDAPATIAPDTVTALGFSANDVLAALVGPFAADAEWVAEEGRAATTVSLSVMASVDPPVFHDQMQVGTTGPDMQCMDYLEVPVSIAFASGDGAFDEVLATSLWVVDLTALSASSPLDWTALGGSFQFVTIDPTAWDQVSLDFETTLVPSFAGQVAVSATLQVNPSQGKGLVGPVLRWPPLD